MPHPSSYRKMLKAVLLLVVGVLLASCGGRSAPQAEATKEPVVVIVTAAPTKEPTEEPTEEPTAEPTEEPTAEADEEPTAEAAEPTAETTGSTSTDGAQGDIQGEFEDVRLNYDVVKNGKKGLEIVSDFSVENAKSKRCHIAAYFSLADGQPLKAGDNAVYSTDDGNVSVGDDFIPKYDSSKFTDYTLFIPYEALNFEEGSGNADVKVVLRLYDDKTKSFFAKSPEQEFTYTQGEPSDAKEVTGKVTDLKVEYDVTEGGKKGLRIISNFTVNDAKGVKCNIGAYFYTADGEKLPAGDNEAFKTPDGQVAVFDNFTPKYDSSDFSDYPLFIPYSALNIKPGTGKVDLKLAVKLYTTVEKPFFAESEDYPFEYTQK